MNAFFDALCSSWLIAIPIGILVFLIICFFIFKAPFTNEKLNSFYRIIMIFMFPIVIFVFSHFAAAVYGFGYATGFEANLNNKKWLCFITEGTFKMHKKRSSVDVDCRLHVLDPKTGERIRKDVIGNFLTAIKLKGDTLLYKSGGSSYILYDVNRGVEAARLASWTLPELFKEFTSGVDEIEYDKYYGLLKATSKNGKTYYIDPFSMQLTTNQSTKDYSPKKDELFLDEMQMNLNANTLITLKGENEDRKLVQLVDDKNGLLNKDLSFVYGQFLYNLPRTKCFLVLSYETTDKANFIINCISDDYKLLWQLKQTELDANDFFTRDNTSGRYSYTAKMDFRDVIDENFIFTIQGFVFSVNLNSGKLNWKSRL